jgi:tetratricopeptide (TPR) repeat protein
MRNLFFLLLFVIFQISVYSQTNRETLTRAGNLVSAKKYASAFQLLQDADPKNGNPDMVLMKEDIAINYFVTSIMHQMFAFKDLEDNEDIMDYRGKNGSFQMYVFAVNQILDSLIRIYPENYKLYKGLGDFYYDVKNRYQGDWLKDDSIVASLIISNYQVVFDHHLADYNTCFRAGLECVELKKYKEAIPFFSKSIELQKDFADGYYNLAYAYLFTDDRENALSNAKRSLDLYNDREYKGDAARMIAQVYIEQNNDREAIRYYELANSLDTGNYYTLKPLLDLYVKTGNSATEATLNAFYRLAPDKPTIYNDLGQIYLEGKKTGDLVEFYKSRLSIYADDKKVSGNLNFFLGQLYLDIDGKKAKEYYLKAKEFFSTIYNKDHAVFDAIKQGIEEAEK